MILFKKLANREYFNFIIKTKRWKNYSPYNKKLVDQLNSFIAFAGLTPDMKILEIGGGFGHSTIPLLLKGFNVTYMDCNEKSAEVFKFHLSEYGSPYPTDIIISDVFSFNSAINYDAIIGFGILHHIVDSREKVESLETLFLKLKSVLSANGIIAFIEPQYTFFYRLYVTASFSMNWNSEKGALYMRRDILENMLGKCSYKKICFCAGKNQLGQIFVKAATD